MTKPIRKPTKPVKVIPCHRDEICPPGGAVVMDRQNFLNLNENVINSESYIQQLENLLDSLLKR